MVFWSVYMATTHTHIHMRVALRWGSDLCSVCDAVFCLPRVCGVFNLDAHAHANTHTHLHTRHTDTALGSRSRWRRHRECKKNTNCTRLAARTPLHHHHETHTRAALARIHHQDKLCPIAMQCARARERQTKRTDDAQTLGGGGAREISLRRDAQRADNARMCVSVCVPRRAVQHD